VRFVEHTADTGIEVSAPSLEACFARSAAGMFACFTAPGAIRAPTQTQAVLAEAGGYEELLMAWLEELLYLSDVKGLAFHEFQVARIINGHLEGWARGPKFGPGAAIVGPEVKAVTRHGLEVRHDARRWRARLYFDV